MDPTRTRTVAWLSLIVTYLFFLEYLPPFQRVHIPFDLEGFHYPLFDYTFQSLRQGRLPLWDPTIYCGMPFAGNTQAALFYPPAWLMFLLSAGREHVSFLALEAVVFLHVWLAFILCFGWLRFRGSTTLSSALGAMVFACSGYLMLQLNHFGVAAGFAWMPLAMWGIDEMARRASWRAFAKIAAASAMCFLAGYPPTWTVLGVCCFTYAIARPRGLRVAAYTACGLAFSFLLASVQLLPAIEPARMKVVEPRYGSGFHDWHFYLSYLIPNYFDFGLHVPSTANPGGEYLYLGVPALFAILFVRRTPDRASTAVLLVSLMAVLNPFDVISGIVMRFPFLSQVVRDWYFLAGITLALAPMAAAACDSFLKRGPRILSRWFSPATLSALVVSTARTWLTRTARTSLTL